MGHHRRFGWSALIAAISLAACVGARPEPETRPGHRGISRPFAPPTTRRRTTPTPTRQSRALAQYTKVFMPPYRRYMHLKSRGRYTAAVPAAKKLLAIVARWLGLKHRAYATWMTRLGALHYHAGRYNRAETLYKRALAIRRQNLGPAHQDVANSLYNLALLYQAMGRYARAEPLLQRAHRIAKKNLGPQHRHVASILNAQAHLNRRLGRLGRAEALYLRALAIRQKKLGPSHLHVANTLDELAIVHHVQGRHVRAEALYRRALAIRQKKLGPHHPQVAASLNNLAGLYGTLGKPSRAEQLLRRALAILRRHLGASHPKVAGLMSHLAVLLVAAGRTEQGWKALRRGFTLRLDRAERLLPTMSEQSREAYLRRFMAEYEVLIDLAVRLARRRPATQREALALALRLEGLLLESLRRQREQAATAKKPGTRRRLRLRNQALRRYNHLIVRGRGPRTVQQYRARLAAADLSLEQAENRLAQATAGRLGRVKTPTIRALSRRLGRREAVISFVQYRQYDFKAVGMQRWRKARYAAFVLRRGRRGSRVVLKDLGPASVVDRLIKRYLRANRTSLTWSHHRGIRWALARINLEARKLYHRIIAPVARHLRGVKRLWISPTGKLGLIPLQLLAMPNNRILGEQYKVGLVDSARDLVRIKRATKQRPRSRRSLNAPVAFTAPDFGGRAGAGRRQFGPLNWRASWSRRLRQLLVTISQRAKQRLLSRSRVTLVTGRQATEARLNRISRPLILHLYTHGFYLPARIIRQRIARRRRSLTGFGPRLGRTLMMLVDPMRRSGIALAGANLRPRLRRPAAVRRGKPLLISAGEDGILTAEEAGTLDLTGTEMVILAACQTGVGETRVGEGMYGLRRALLYAGARSLLVTLWKVPEKQTRELLFDFLAALARGQSKAAALRWAQARIRKRYPLPFYWAGFVLIGDPGQIR